MDTTQQLMAISYVLLGIQLLLWGLTFFIYRNKKMQPWLKWVVGIFLVIAGLTVGVFQTHFRKAAANNIAKSTIDKALGQHSPVLITDQSESIPKSYQSNESQNPYGSEENTPTYLIQIGAYRAEEDATAQQRYAAALGFQANVSTTVVRNDGIAQSIYRVRIGPFTDLSASQAISARLDELHMKSVIIRVDHK